MSALASPEFVDNLLAFFSTVGAAFLGGLLFATWRALTWVERMRAWAHALPAGEAARTFEAGCTDPVSVHVSEQGTPLALLQLQGMGSE